MAQSIVTVSSEQDHWIGAFINIVHWQLPLISPLVSQHQQYHHWICIKKSPLLACFIYVCHLKQCAIMWLKQCDTLSWTILFTRTRKILVGQQSGQIHTARWSKKHIKTMVQCVPTATSVSLWCLPSFYISLAFVSNHTLHPFVDRSVLVVSLKVHCDQYNSGGIH